MRQMRIEALYRKLRTSIPAREATICPYLLEILVISAQSGLVRGFDLFADRSRVYVLDGDFGCGERQSLVLAAVEHTDGGFLCRSARGGDEGIRTAGDFQYRSGIAIHERGLDHAAEGRRRRG